MTSMEPIVAGRLGGVASGAHARDAFVHGQFLISRHSDPMAGSTSRVLMGARQRVSGFPIVIEQRWLPLPLRMAPGAIGAAGSVELAAVLIFMTSSALVRRRLKLHAAPIGLWILAPVATIAGRQPVLAGERKLGVAVIEAGQFRPRPVAVAHGAILRHTAGSRP